MQNISIDFITQDNIKIIIDGEELKDIEGFCLKIKQGKEPYYTVKKKVIKQQKPLKEVKENTNDKNIPLWRSIHRAAECLKEEDPQTSISEWRIRQLVANREISYITDSKGKLVDLNEIRRYYNNKKINAVSRLPTKIKAIR